jgi:hypothetical protein
MNTLNYQVALTRRDDLLRKAAARRTTVEAPGRQAFTTRLRRRLHRAGGSRAATAVSARIAV